MAAGCRCSMALKQESELHSADAPYLVARRVCRAFEIGGRQIVVLQPINLSVKRGEFVAVTGPSGSGKSTLLNLLSGLDRPTSGRVLVGGVELWSISDASLARIRNAEFGFMFQAPHMLRSRSVRENLSLPIRYARLAAVNAAERRVNELLDYVGLSSFADRSPATLSGGELQRVAFARALLLDPAIIFADEPTAALDDVNSNLLLSLLVDQANQGKVVVMATHDPFARAFAQREVRMHKVTDALA